MRKFKTRNKFSIGKNEGSALDGTPILTCTLLKREHFLKKSKQKECKGRKRRGVLAMLSSEQATTTAHRKSQHLCLPA